MQRPDVALESSAALAPLDWVGMNSITVPVQIISAGRSFNPVAQVSAFVSLDKQARRGIHMSRLYASVQERLGRDVLSPELLQKCVADFLESHKDLSRHGRISVSLPWPVQRKALVSELSAWRTYPVTVSCETRDQVSQWRIALEVEYSSTCPASAALARQLIQNQFSQSFRAGEVSHDQVHQWLGSTQGVVATPHAQRSGARVTLTLAPGAEWEVLEWIERLEGALGTPVQTMVKREDEQEFALRNGQNLMFCEDAARRLKTTVESVDVVKAFEIEVQHYESLHPHNAVCVVSGTRI